MIRKKGKHMFEVWESARITVDGEEMNMPVRDQWRVMRAMFASESD